MSFRYAATCLAIDLQAAGFEHLRGRSLSTDDAEPGTDACDEFGQPEGLGHVVVGTGVETDDDVHLLGACGEHDDGQLRGSRPSPPAHVEPVDVGQREVEQQQLRSIALDRLDGSAAGLDVGDVETFRHQHSYERFADSFVVFNQENRGHEYEA